MLLISVIVPVYNTEQYLPDCLHSILNQTYQNIEIILVNDGSTDNSLQICMDYAETDPRITVIQNSHQGLVATRKSGVEAARGDYCMFVDSDDWIAENLLESILPLTEDGHIDMICYNMESVENQKHIPWHHTIPEGKYEQQQLETVCGKMMFDFEEGSPGILQSLSVKLIKTPLLLERIKPLDPRISMGEDAAVTYTALLHAKKVVITNKVFYFYNELCFCERIHSICSVVGMERSDGKLIPMKILVDGKENPIMKDCKDSDVLRFVPLYGNSDIELKYTVRELKEYCEKNGLPARAVPFLHFTDK